MNPEREKAPAVVSSEVERLAQMIMESESVVALTGAGISVPSGIPDFRSPGTGLWENVDPMEVAHIDVFRRDPARFWQFYRPRFGMLADKRPNGAHYALAQLEQRGLLDAVITQNIDRLHRMAGSRRVVEVHGTIETSSCMDCAQSYTLEQVEELFDGVGVAACRSCGGFVKPDVVLFGEMLPEAAMSEAVELCSRAQLLLCVGSSLEVYPVAGLPELASRGGARLAIITKGTTPYDSQAQVRLGGDVVAELGQVVACLPDAPAS
jgi:NAD-dependent protein deacetylase/lipoamidase